MKLNKRKHQAKISNPARPGPRLAKIRQQTKDLELKQALRHPEAEAKAPKAVNRVSLTVKRALERAASGNITPLDEQILKRNGLWSAVVNEQSK